MKKLAVIGLSGLLSACVLEEDNSEPTFLEGTYASECEDFDGGTYGLRTLSFEGNKLTVISNTYSDSDCQTLRSSNIAKASFTVGEELILPESGLVVTQVEFNYSQFVATALNDEAAATYNTDRHCGFTDWTVNEGKEILACFLEARGGNPVKDVAYLEDGALDFGDVDYIGENGFPTRLSGDPITRR